MQKLKVESSAYFFASICLLSQHVSTYMFLGIKWTAKVALASPKMVKTNSVHKWMMLYEGYFSVNRKKKKSHKGQNEKLGRSRRTVLTEFCKLHYMCIQHVPTSGKQSSQYPSNSLELELMLLENDVTPVHGQPFALKLMPQKQWQITGFFPESWGHDLIRWCHLDCEPYWGHAKQLSETLMGFGTSRNTFLLTWRIRKVSAYCPSVI